MSSKKLRYLAVVMGNRNEARQLILERHVGVYVRVWVKVWVRAKILAVESEVSVKI